MTPSPDMPSNPSAAQKSVNTFTKLANLASTSISMLHEPPRIPKKSPPPELFLGDTSYALRLDEDVMNFSNLGELTICLEDLPEKEIDIVFAGRTAFDLTFQVPNGPFNDLEAIIETELEFRSPIQSDQSVWFWSAKETPNGDWIVEAAIVLKGAVDWVLDAMEHTGKSINLARRHRPDGSLRVAVAPYWLDKPSRLASAGSILAHLRKIPPTLRFPIGAFTLFFASATALFFVQSIRSNSVTEQANEATAKLRELAAEQAVTRGLQERRDMGNARLTIIGTMANALPDGVWLEQMLVDGEDVTIIGFAPSAAEVTRLLAALPSLKDIEFGSPVTRDNTQNLERFRINAVLTGEI
jgi:hypothetical protein